MDKRETTYPTYWVATTTASSTTNVEIDFIQVDMIVIVHDESPRIQDVDIAALEEKIPDEEDEGNRVEPNILQMCLMRGGLSQVRPRRAAQKASGYG
ncbi:hypothetical protein M0R72_18080 [Candidatus Pacearchaeota archaeon]|nr:hypothetical protein [Candidatus Pacearchaeota archaeon]